MQPDIEFLEEKAYQIRRLCVEMITYGQWATSGVFSLAALRQAYFGQLQRHLDEAARLNLLALMERTIQAMPGVMREEVAIVSRR